MSTGLAEESRQDAVVAFAEKVLVDYARTRSSQLSLTGSTRSTRRWSRSPRPTVEVAKGPCRRRRPCAAADKPVRAQPGESLAKQA